MNLAPDPLPPDTLAQPQAAAARLRFTLRFQEELSAAVSTCKRYSDLPRNPRSAQPAAPAAWGVAKRGPDRRPHAVCMLRSICCVPLDPEAASGAGGRPRMSTAEGLPGRQPVGPAAQQAAKLRIKAPVRWPRGALLASAVMVAAAVAWWLCTCFSPGRLSSG